MENDNAPVTKADLKAGFKEFGETFKLEMSEFLNDSLLPAIDGMIKEESKELRQEIQTENAKLRHELKDYIDRKLATHHADIVSAFRGDAERDKTYKFKILEILDRNKLIDNNEFIILKEMVE